MVNIMSFTHNKTLRTLNKTSSKTFKHRLIQSE